VSAAPPLLGLRHVALRVPAQHFDQTVDFYTRLVGMTLEWQPDQDSAYLSSGGDNLALHRVLHEVSPDSSVDHVGFALHREEDVDAWHDFLLQAGVSDVGEVHQHRDGARSFYCRAPDGTQLQFIHHTGMKDAD